MLHNPFREVTPYTEIVRQATWIWQHYELEHIWPDGVQRVYEGYITKADLQEILRLTRGDRSAMGFLFGLVRFYNPRRHRQAVAVQSDHLIRWSSWRTYRQQLEGLEARGLLNRCSGYRVGACAKKITLCWSFQPSSDALLHDGRNVELEQALRLAFSPEEFRAVLQDVQPDRKRRSQLFKSIFPA